MLVAGLELDSGLVVELAKRLFEEGMVRTAERLLEADANDAERVSLTISEREAILWTLADCPDEVVPLRSVLVNELDWRHREL
jgi:hypothetical protein